MTLGFPGGAVVENLPASAGDTGSSPGLGRSHVPRSSWTREPQLLSLRVWSLCSATREATIVRGPRTTMKSGPRLLQLEKALAQKRRPNTAINKKKKKKKIFFKKNNNNDSYFSAHYLFCLKYFFLHFLTFSTWGDAEVLILNHVALASVLRI